MCILCMIIISCTSLCQFCCQSQINVTCLNVKSQQNMHFKKHKAFIFYVLTNCTVKSMKKRLECKKNARPFWGAYFAIFWHFCCDLFSRIFSVKVFSHLVVAQPVLILCKRNKNLNFLNLLKLLCRVSINCHRNSFFTQFRFDQPRKIEPVMSEHILYAGLNLDIFLIEDRPNLTKNCITITTA
jgi:hypothetical protein